MNVRRAEALIEAGRMTTAGRQAFDRRGAPSPQLGVEIRERHIAHLIDHAPGIADGPTRQNKRSYPTGPGEEDGVGRLL